MRRILLLLAFWACDDAASGSLDADLLVDAEVDGVMDGALPDPPACTDDRLGFGTAALPAIDLAPGVIDDLVLCPPEGDWFGIDAPVGTRLTVQVRADRPVQVRWADTVSGVGRRVEVEGVVQPGGAVIGIEAADAAAAVGYALTIVETLSACDDGFAPGEVVLLNGPAEGAVCGTDRDRFEVQGPPGAQVIWSLTVLEGAAHVADVVELDGGEVAVQTAQTRMERRLDADGRARLRVEPAGAGGRYRISAQVTDLDAMPASRTGTVRVPDRAVGVEGLGAPTYQPVEGVLVDAIVEGQLAALTRTDATGAFAVRYAAPMGADVVVRARASVWAPPFFLTVGPSFDTPWAATLEDEQVDLSADEPAGGALHIAQVMAEGVQGIAPFLPQLRDTPPITVRWTPGGSAACGTCYRPGTDVIEISGRLTDPDEWDDAILLHELAHHFAARYGRDDSPGGAHDGDPVAPALAWSEGFATMTGAWLNGDAIVLDHRATGAIETDLENMDDPRAFGTAGDRVDGAVSEYLVAAVLWDLLDDPEDDDDAFALSPAAVFGAAFAGLRVREDDAGGPGMDLLDHAEEIACRAEVDPSPALMERGVEADVRCLNKAGAIEAVLKGLSWTREAGAAVSR